MTPRDLCERLARLHAAHLLEVDRALDAGRPDLAREMSDVYADEALALITGEGTAAMHPQ